MRVPLLLLFLIFLPAFANAEAQVSLSSGPARILVEALPDRQDLNFEIFIGNDSSTDLTLERVQVSAYDAQGQLLLRRLLDGNGVRPSIQTLPAREVKAGQVLTVFNPFPSFAPELAIARLRYELTLVDATGKQVSRPLEVQPQAHAQRTALALPVRGRQINYDGHDYLAHHRRFDYRFAPLAQMGFRSNFMRYGYDFVPVDGAGEMHRGDGARNEDYVGFGAEVRASGDGRVVAAEGERADDRQFDQARIPTDPMVLFGNHLVIDHGNGEFSVYGHLQQHSLRVKVGERVRRGQPVARIGASGSALFPHLHYQLQDGPSLAAEGLPSYFDDVRVWQGAASRRHARATVDTGQIVESAR